MDLSFLRGIDIYTTPNIYDMDNRLMLHYYPRRILEILGKHEELSLLDLGLGHGYSALEFCGKTKEYTILEGSIELIERFRDRKEFSNVCFVHTFFENYETDKNFDVIVLGFVLEHVDDPLLILKKYRSMLTKGGKMFLAVPNAETLNRRIGYAANLLSDMTQLSEHDRASGHKRYFIHDSINELCKRAGLRVILEEGIYLKPFTTKQILSLNLDDSIMDALCVVGRNYPELSLGILIQCEPKL